MTNHIQVPNPLDYFAVITGQQFINFVIGIIEQTPNASPILPSLSKYVIPLTGQEFINYVTAIVALDKSGGSVPIPNEYLTILTGHQFFNYVTGIHNQLT